MNDRQIECFLEAGRLLNFTRAAENLLLPQPAVSRYITVLERELGVQLFAREGSRKVSLTEEGRIYYNLFRRTELELTRTKQALSDSTPFLRVGVNKSWDITGLLARVEALCKKKDPAFRVEYECLHFHDLTTKLLEGRLDAVISMENYVEKSPELTYERITSVERLIIYSNRLPECENLHLPSDFYPYDFLVADDPLIHRIVHESESTFHSYQFIPRFRTVPNQETVLLYVQMGAGVALQDQWCYALQRPHMRSIPIDEYEPVALARRFGISPPALTLYQDCLIDCCKAQSQEKHRHS